MPELAKQRGFSLKRSRPLWSPSLNIRNNKNKYFSYQLGNITYSNFLPKDITFLLHVYD